MTNDESLAVITAKLECSPAEREIAHTVAREGILVEIASAPTAALKARYQRKLSNIEAAYAATDTARTDNLPTTVSRSAIPSLRHLSETPTEIPAPPQLPKPVESVSKVDHLGSVSPRKGFMMAGIGVLVLLVIYTIIHFTSSKESVTSEPPIEAVLSDSVPDSGTSGTTQPTAEVVSRERQDFANMKEEMDRMKLDIAKAQQQGLEPVVSEAPVTNFPQRPSVEEIEPSVPPSPAVRQRSPNSGEIAWKDYSNGYCRFQYPAALVANSEQSDECQRELYTPNKEFMIQLLYRHWVSDEAGSDKEALESNWKSELKENDGTITYKKMGSNWYIISGVSKKGMEYYRKLFMKDGNWVLLHIGYPHAKNMSYDPWVERISKSFVPILDGHGSKSEE